MTKVMESESTKSSALQTRQEATAIEVLGLQHGACLGGKTDSSEILFLPLRNAPRSPLLVPSRTDVTGAWRYQQGFRSSNPDAMVGLRCPQGFGLTYLLV